ncbi:CGNR zinc finger domain-containing protein [Streptomyces sp. 049-1]|uniref:CGNR zinc finger domain-containing protein n=1 Tax=Streptomyces sp. 049-1 TaxID=2789264 RepID=UPI00397EBBAF
MTDEAREGALLDLLNTTPVVRGAVRDALELPAEAQHWARQHGWSGGREEIGHLTAARDALQEIVRGTREPESLNSLLEGVKNVPYIDGGRVDWTLHAPEGRGPAAEMVLAWSHLQETRPGRLRPCANPECRRFLLDRSKPNSARWCSMSECGNRMKARRHYQRSKGADAGN